MLGHLQRGGAPSCFDTVLASKLGLAAIETLVRGDMGMMVGRISGTIVSSPLSTAWQERRALDRDMIELMETLSI